MLHKVKIGYVDGSSEWEEELEVPDGESPEAWCAEIIDDFNAHELDRYGKKARLRKLIAVVEKTDRTLHDWVKFHTDGHGVSLYGCETCNLLCKCSGLNTPPSTECHPDRVCTECNKEFKSAANLERHMIRKHEY